MKSPQKLPMQKKMLSMSLLICGAVLCVAVATLFSFQIFSFRHNFQRDTTTLAAVIANNSMAAMSFEDQDAASEVLSSLRARSNIVSASLVQPDGKLFARYGAPESADAWAKFPAAGASAFSRGNLLLRQPILCRGELIGTLCLRADYQDTLFQLLHFYGLVVLGVLVVSTSLAAFLSKRLGERITRPILDLARTARIVGEKQDYSVRAPVSDEGEEVARLTESFNEMLARIQTQDAALSLSQQRMQALINSIDGIVWERDPRTDRFTFISRQSQEILGYPPDEWLKSPEFWESRLHPQDCPRAVRARQESVAKGVGYSCEYRVTAADGRTVWMRESGTIILDAGQAAATRGIFLDITRQKQAAAELDKLNRQLMDTSRRAGMAEVATGVLHNVGNVLNSVSVAATVVTDRLRKSKLGNLCRAATVLRDKNGQLADFLTHDPKGKLIPEYLVTVSNQLSGEQAKLVAKMELLGEHIEHMKEIVAMQQNYAKVSGVYENLPVASLVDDALRMNLAAFDRHGIELVRDFQDNLPPVHVDRHKVLQILINLLRNAKYAIDARRGQPKRLTVRLFLASPERVAVTVADTGIGIAPENLTRIFNHGFTTKKDGHGFGLHSGANAAKEMGGTLSARSNGIGHGAEFTLELPTAAFLQREAAAQKS